MDHHLSSQKTTPLMAGAVDTVYRKMAQEKATAGLTDTEAVRLTKPDKPQQRSGIAKERQHKVETACEITGPEATMVPLSEISEEAMERWKATFEAVVALLSERDAIEGRQETAGGGTRDSIESVISERVVIDGRSETGGMGAGVVGREAVGTKDRTRGTFRIAREPGDEAAVHGVRVGNSVPNHGIHSDGSCILEEFKGIVCRKSSASGTGKMYVFGR